MSFNRLVRILSLAIIVIFLASCGGGQTRTPSRYPSSSSGPSKKYPLSGKSYVIKGKRYHLLSSSTGYDEKGEASWYGRYFHGKKTASGERYNMYDRTAAHKTLPLQTWVRVTNLSNNREIVVRINDRGPFARARIIDLSYSAAKDLGMVNKGVAPVRVTALGKTENRRINGKMEAVLVQPKSYNQGRFSVQVAAFQVKNNADRLAAKLRRDFEPVRVVPFDRGDAIFFRVQVADKHTLDEAVLLQTRLENIGYRDCFVVAQ